MDLKTLKKKLKADRKNLRKMRKKQDAQDEGHTNIPAQICFLVEKESELAYLDGKISSLNDVLEVLNGK